MGTFFKNSQSPLYGQVLPLLPKRLKAFLLFRVWLRTFSPSLFKEQQQAPRVPWEHRGGRARWERGIRHAQQASRWEKENRAGGRQKDGEKEEEESAFERCFQLLFFFFFFCQRQGPSLCEKRQGEKKHDGRRGRKKKKEKTCHVFYQTLKLRERVFFLFFFKKSFRPTSKKTFLQN